MEELLNDIEQLIGLRVKYSKTGGGASSILLLTFQHSYAIWAWRYWEIIKNGIMIANSNDDDTPLTGKMAIAANQLVGKKVVDVSLKKSYNLKILFEKGLEIIIKTEFEKDPSLMDLNNWEYELPQKDKCYTINSQQNLEISKYY